MENKGYEKSNRVFQTKLIREEIRNALKEKKSVVEFLNGAYNYERLHSYVYSVFERIFVREIFNPASLRAKQKADMILKSRVVTPLPYSYQKKAFRVRSERTSKRVRVFCDIDHEYIAILEHLILEDILKKYKGASS